MDTKTVVVATVSFLGGVAAAFVGLGVVGFYIQRHINEQIAKGAVDEALAA